MNFPLFPCSFNLLQFYEMALAWLLIDATVINSLNKHRESRLLNNLANDADQSLDSLGNQGKRSSFNRERDNLILFKDNKRHKIGRKYTV